MSHYSSPQGLPPAGARFVPTPLTPLVDRQRELDRILGSLRRPEVRLVTLTGAAGAGKTRLAIEAALILGDEFPDGARFLDLAGLSEPHQVTAVVMQALGVRRFGPKTTDVERARAACDRRLLLVLDNFEHVLAAAPQLVESMRACPGVKALVTSRAALRVRGEHELPIPPLPVLDPAEACDLVAAASNPAIALFIACAQAVQPDFTLDCDSAPIIAEICRRLDGLPLAIELAAARAHVMPVQVLLARLERRLDLLTGGARDLPPRQQTLRGALTWSYDLLPPAQQLLFRQVSVFEGGCTLDAVSSVCGDQGSEDGVLEGLTALVDNSLLRLDPRQGRQPRYRILDTIREFALERLRGDAGELRATYERHAQYFLDLAESSSSACLLDPDEAAPDLASDADNVRAALRWAIDNREIDIGLRLASGLAPVWRLDGALAEGRRSLEALFAAADSAHPSPAHPRALWLAGLLGERDGDLDSAESYYRGAITSAQELGDMAVACGALDRLGVLANLRGDLGAAERLLSESIELGHAHGARGLRWPMLHLALVLADRQRTADASHSFEAALSSWGGDASRAGQLAAAALAILAVELAEPRRARVLLEPLLADPALGLSRARLALVLEALAGVALERGAAERTLRLAAAAESVAPPELLGLSALCRPLVQRRVAEARGLLRPDVAAAAWSAGQTMSIEQALDLARQVDPHAAPRAADLASARTGVERLTTREREVLEMLARGSRNRDIARQLVISERTAEWHVANVLGKLQLDSRAQLAHWFGERGPVV